jgi:hypothetical protein
MIESYKLTLIAISLFLIIAISLSGNINGEPKTDGDQKNAARPKICEYCKEVINGPYVEVDGKYYHPIHFLCEHCRNPIIDLKYYKKDGKYYCERCYFELFKPKCACCGKPIIKDGVIVDGKTYHDSCYNRFIAPRCALCGEIIEDTCIEDFWGNKYHSYHKGKAPQCMYCGRFISENLTHGGDLQADGRYICGLCKRSAITDIASAETLVEDVRMRLNYMGIIIPAENTRVHLAESAELKRISAGRFADPMGFAKYREVLSGKNVTARASDIYLLKGMPESHFISVAAHELMHLWQYANAQTDNNPALCEGSCNYASYLILQQYQTKEAAYMISGLMHDPDEYYGEGFRRVKKFVDENGIDGWLDLLKSSRTLPDGY